MAIVLLLLVLQRRLLVPASSFLLLVLRRRLLSPTPHPPGLLHAASAPAWHAAAAMAEEGHGAPATT
ncbi:hypothetical protein E2562_019849 [Oryza meyeriana var. granulata]|uniref:Uncharacterized protein n=1 Tax=Oryza meyeriana var. granulata TaxID=110450 RepID=A0A6G1CS11_9ORYZ|nr:hypothetical protein E2562_019849 [Oryza meyeriana var. granulata]